MSIENALQARSGSKCELCAATDHLSVYEIPPNTDSTADSCVLVCATCHTQISDPQQLEVHHWRCLNDSMWSQVPAVQVMAWRMLNRLRGEGWAQELLDMLYLDDETLAWAQADASDDQDDTIRHVDSNGALLAAGDTVTLTQDLKVKGGNFTAKRGTPVRNITLVSDNPEHIEGRVNGQKIVILTKFVKKSG